MGWNGLCHFGSGAFGAWGWAGLALNFLLWAALIAAAVYLISRVVNRSTNTYPAAFGKPQQSAIGIAQERYARGEISRVEYLNLLADLE